MGMYTQLQMSFSLKEETPKLIVRRLNGMIYEHKYDGWKKPYERLNWCLNSASYYFDDITSSSIKYDSDQYRVNILCDFKNYNDEIGKFITWIMPYIDAEKGRMIGYYRYEEDYKPTIIYKEEE